ncbi:GNAT family N-acetyltransferase [Dyadobacter sp. CY323]|uniref:GNAT family N-acetyltransferase n=1 Tax=Dyadobacter sp. CY323 TaxID=2907302 RepID=UPI001F189670|nr:GNAT family N-acetyltransferase [Dyadobacter sp. CY323]MCE6987943.1 GNAT family N-acetyltransferase [Dyadobacter sp. CY323]
MEDILDNPAWNALASHNNPLGFITETAAYFDPAVSPFVALSAPTQACLNDLYQTVPFDDDVVLVSNAKLAIEGLWEKVIRIDGFQMIYRGPERPVVDGPEPVQLGKQFVPRMLALTKLTNPGPFLPKTINFGHYEGIFEGDQLIAMAGQRLHLNGFAEISAVCTHPDHLGKGYARRLLLRQVNRIQEASETPFLHAKADNTRAIGVYESLGFEIRTEIFFYILSKSTK